MQVIVEPSPFGGGGNTKGLRGNNKIGITTSESQTLTIKDLSSFEGFKTYAITNGGTVEVQNVKFASNTTDINNTGTLNLSGNNEISTIAGAGTTNITGGNTIISEGGSVTQNKINLQCGRLVNSGAITANVVADEVHSASSDSFGGAIYNKGTISNITGIFKDNTVNHTLDNSFGGAIFNDVGSNISTVKAGFTNNTAFSGGAIYNMGNYLGNGVIDKIIGNFTGNKALGAGGAIANFGTINQLSGSFTNNTASSGGAIYNDGILTIKSLSEDSITFSNNKAYNAGGAIVNSDYSTKPLTITADGSSITFDGNSAKNGGALYNKSYVYEGTVDGGIITLNATGADITFTGNTATEKGGAIYNNYGATVNMNSTGENKISFETSSDTIHNEGTININGNVVINSLITDNATPTGTLNLNGGKTTLAKLVQNTVNITAGELEVADITAAINNGGILTLKGNNENTINNYTDSESVVHAGSTVIAESLTNTGAINQAITVNGSKTLTTAANLIGGVVTNGGTVELTGGTLSQIISGGDITIASGEVTSTVANLGGTITNNSNLLLSGTLDKNIAGDSGITKLADNMTFADGAGVAGTLNFNGKAITMSGDNKTSTFNIGKINSDGTINIDVNTSGSPVSDVINITTAGSTGTITINSINEIGARGDNFTLNVLQGNTGSLQLALSDAVQSQFNQEAQHNLYYVSDAYDATIDFDKTSFNTAEWDRVTQKTIGVEDNTKITYATHVISDTATGVVPSKDALAFINQNTDTSAVANRSMVTSDTDKTYTVQEDLGTTGAGTLLVQGASDKTTKLDMNNHSGFVVANSGTAVTLKDINVDNVQNTDGGLVNITNTGSSATLDGAVVNVKDNPENKANVISSNGTLGVTNSTVNAGVNNNGTMNLNGTNQISSVEGSNGSANVQTGTTTVGSIFQKLINIVTGGKLASNGDVTATNGITNDTANGLSVANGTLTGNVTGSGSTDFKGTSAIADGSTVGQAITVVDGKLTTLADGLGGVVTNGGEVDLTGGTLETSIRGGNTTISGNVGVDDTTGSIASAVKVETGAKLTTNADKVTGAINNGGNLDLTGGDIKNAISGDGNTTISGTVTNTTGSAIGNAVTVATTGNLTTAADKIGGAVTNGGTVQLDGGTLSQTITGGNLNIKDSVLTSADNLKADTTTVAASKDLTLNGGNLTKDITGSGNTKIAGTVTNSANIQTATEITSGSLDNTNGNLANVTVTSGSLKSNADNISGTVANNGTYEITGGTIANAISGTGAVNITGNVINNAVNTTTGAVSVADNVELAVGTSGDAFASASSVTMGNNSTLNIQNGATTNAVMDNLIIATGDNVNVKMDWNDTINSSSGNINGNLTVTDINMATSTSSYEATSYAFTNLGSKIALSDTVSLSNVSDTTNNFVSYNNTTGQLTSFRNSLMGAVDKTEAGETATYVMTGDETAGGQTLEGKLLVQGDGHTITTAGVKVHSSTATPAELTLQDTNMNVAGKAIEVTGNNKAIVKASGHDITLQTTDSSEVVSLNKSGTDYAQAEMTGAKTITINGDIKSDDVNNTLTIASGSTVNHAGLLDPITTNVNGTYNRTSGYDETVTYNVNSGGALNFTNDMTLYDAGHHTAAMLNTINFNGGSVNTINGVVTDFQLANMSLTGTTNNFYADVDLANQTMDKFTVANPVTGTGTLNVAGLNLISDAANVNTTINFTTDPVLMAATSYTGGQGLTALSPIYKYNVGYDNTTGNFNFTRYNTGGYGDYSPSILAAPVAAQLGGYLTQLNSYDEAFRNMDMYMLMTAQQRQALKNKNKIASIDGGVLYDATLMRQERAEGWFRPFATFEKVPLKNGPKVENIAYGTYMGGESQMYDLGHGWDGIWGAYVGYNGSHQNYDGVSIYQNGGTLGVLGMAYKGNFFTGLTINAGASGVEASTMYGNEDFAMLMAGIASKTGYNWELFNGKFIIQPSMLMSYSFVNTFDYKNAAGVNVDSDPLHAIQLQPEIKFIGNLKNGWQPYASVAVVWNIMDDTKFKANDVALPELSVKPYVKYEVSVRKTWGERLTGFFKTYITNGGRNGVGLQAGFTWALGGGSDKNANVEKIHKSLNKVPELEKTEIVLNGKKVQ